MLIIEQFSHQTKSQSSEDYFSSQNEDYDEMGGHKYVFGISMSIVKSYLIRKK